MNQQGSQKIDAYRRASSYPAAGQLYLPDSPLLRRPLKREDVKRKLIAHKNCIHEIGQDWGADNISQLMGTTAYFFSAAIARTSESCGVKFIFRPSCAFKSIQKVPGN